MWSLERLIHSTPGRGRKKEKWRKLVESQAPGNRRIKPRFHRARAMRNKPRHVDRADLKIPCCPRKVIPSPRHLFWCDRQVKNHCEYIGCFRAADFSSQAPCGNAARKTRIIGSGRGACQGASEKKGKNGTPARPGGG